MTLEPDSLHVHDIDHLGIIAGLIDQLGIVEIIDSVIPTHPQEKISTGLVVKAMILNAMGFLTAPMNLFSQFFQGKATQLLLGPDILPDYLNDSRLGRVLDHLFDYGLTELFIKISAQMVPTLQIDISQVHLDSTSFSVHGQYLSSDSAQEDSDLSSEPVPIILTHGYSRDRRPDLKRFICHLITNGRDGIPLAMATKDGNASDLATFPQVIREFRALWGQESEQQSQFYVMDSAFYSQDNITNDWQSLYWICRIPARLSEVKEILSTLESSQFTDHPEQKNYSTFSLCSSYAGVWQRWLVVR